MGSAVHGLGIGGAGLGCFARPRDSDAVCVVPAVCRLVREFTDRSSLPRRSCEGVHCDDEPTVEGGREEDEARRSRLRAGEELPGDDVGDESREEPRERERIDCIMKGALGGRSGMLQSIAYGIPIGMPMFIIGMPIMGMLGVIMPGTIGIIPVGICGTGGVMCRLEVLPPYTGKDDARSGWGAVEDRSRMRGRMSSDAAE